MADVAVKSRFLACAVGLAVCLGCGGADATVQGTVTIDGQLAPRGTVSYHPSSGGPIVYSTIAEDGSYALRVGQGDLSDPNAGTIPSGEYIVTAVVNMPSTTDAIRGESAPPVPGARLTAEKYANKDTSDLRVSVKPGPNIVPLELEGAAVEVESSEGDAATESEGTTEPKATDAPPDANAPAENGSAPASTESEAS